MTASWLPCPSRGPLGTWGASCWRAWGAWACCQPCYWEEATRGHLLLRAAAQGPRCPRTGAVARQRLCDPGTKCPSAAGHGGAPPAPAPWPPSPRQSKPPARGSTRPASWGTRGPSCSGDSPSDSFPGVSGVTPSSGKGSRTCHAAAPTSGPSLLTRVPPAQGAEQTASRRGKPQARAGVCGDSEGQAGLRPGPRVGGGVMLGGWLMASGAQ